MDELTVVEGRAVAQHRESPTVLEIIQAVASDPRMDVAKLEQLLNLQERMEARNAEMEFNRAMARLQPQLPRIGKHGKIDLGRGKPLTFAKYEDIDAAIRPLLTAEGFTLSFSSEPTDKGVLMTCTLSHSLGHSRSSRMQLPPDSGPGRNALQAIGSSHSYGKRYLVAGILNLVMEGVDDDGNNAEGFITEKECDTLMDMLAECGATGNPKVQSDFLKYMGAKTVGEIRKADYKKAFEACQAKVRSLHR